MPLVSRTVSMTKHAKDAKLIILAEKEIRAEQERLRLLNTKPKTTPSKCICCADEFMSAFPHAKYCSKQCKSKQESRDRQRKLVVKNCIRCNTEFLSREDAHTLHCSMRCGGLTSYSSRISPGGGKWDGLTMSTSGPVNVNCPPCM